MPEIPQNSAGYVRLDPATVPDYLAGVPELAARLGGEKGAWRVREVSDGNLNLVFIVEGPAGSLCLKQALPHVRLDKNWPLPLDRAAYEATWLRRVTPHVGALVPALHHFDPALYLIVMEVLSPHIVLRGGLIAGKRYPHAAEHVARYVADACYFTSDLALPFERKFADMALFAGNEALLRITVNLILTDPYVVSSRNHWAQPYLDAPAASLRADAALKVAVGRLGHRFLSCTQALLHGDLHTGSVMVTETDTRVIDGEFALYGPIGFDLGAYVGNLLLAYFAQPGHETVAGERAEYQEWLLSQIPLFWTTFRDRFLANWRAGGTGDAYPAAFFVDPEGAAALEGERLAFIRDVWRDLLGYAGMKMLRRLVGYAQVADFGLIEPPQRRAALQAQALGFARWLILHAAEIADPQAVIAHARGFVPEVPAS
jgi:5-methylthioribose kinase